MATYTVSSGQTVSGVTLNTGDTMNVLKGGSAINTTINGPGMGISVKQTNTFPDRHQELSSTTAVLKRSIRAAWPRAPSSITWVKSI